MSTLPGNSDEVNNTQDLNSTGVFEPPTSTSSLAESALYATGAFEVAAPGDANQSQAGGFTVNDKTALLPPEMDEEAVVTPSMPGTVSLDAPGGQLRQANSDGTAFFPPSTSDADKRDDATTDGGTGVYTPENTSGTGVYTPEDTSATGVYAPGPTQSRGQSSATDATGAFEVGNADGGDLSGATDLLAPGGATSAQGNRPKKGASTAPTERCGQYVLKRFHAKGGMGEIWMAVDPDIGRSVALKRMLSHRPDQQRRFRIEAQVTGQLEHPGIVPIHQLGINEQGQPFYVMKFVHGQTLQKVIDDHHEAKLGDSEVERFRLLQIFLSLCQTVAYAHSRGVLHRDLKPENVMLGPYGETLLLDWGIAKVLGQPEKNASEAEVEAEYVQLLETGGAESETRAGTIMGSLSYMSPEVAQGKNKEADQRSDVFLLGGILYAMLTGRPPRQGKNPMDLIKQAQRELPPTPRKLNPQIPKALDAICMKALTIDPKDRYPSAKKLAEDIQFYSAGEPVSAYREDFLERAERWAKRHRKALTRTAGAMLIVCLFVFGYFKYRQLEAQWAAEKVAAQQREDDLKEKSRLAQEENERLKKVDEAKSDVKKFRALADEARFYAATTDPVSEHAPYFDPREGDTKARTALDFTKKWGPALEELPLSEEHAQVQKDRYDLLLLRVQSRLQERSDPEAGREALVMLEEASHLGLQRSRGFFRLQMRAHQQIGDKEKAAKDEIDAAEPSTPDTAQDFFLAGEEYRKKASGKGDEEKESQSWKPDPIQMEEAIKQYRLALEKERNHFWSQFQLGRCYLALGRFSEASEALGTCVALRPESPWGYSVRGFAYAQQKEKYKDAEKDLNKAVELDENFRPARLNRGVVLWLQGKNDKAEKDFDKVLERPDDKRLIEAAFFRGQLYAQQNKLDEAEKDFDLVVKESPNLRPVYQHRALIRIAKGKYDLALEDLSTYLFAGTQFDGPHWLVHAKRGHLLRVMFLELPADKRKQAAGKAMVALALTELRLAAAMAALRSPEQRVYDDLGTMLYHSGDAKGALTAYNHGLDIAPRDVLLLIKRGWFYDGLGQRDKALADFMTACQVEPKNAEAHSGQGYILALQKSESEAQRQADLAVLWSADKYLVLHNVACIYSMLSLTPGRQAVADQDVAMVLLRRAVELWEEKGTGLNEIEEIRGDSAFKPLENREDFQELIRPKKKP